MKDLKFGDRVILKDEFYNDVRFRVIGRKIYYDANFDQCYKYKLRAEWANTELEVSGAEIKENLEGTYAKD
jgi:hypothetical protein